MEALKSTSTAQIKQRNRIRVFRSILKWESITKPELAAATGLSLPTVTQVTNELCARGLVKEIGVAASTGGRRPLSFQPVSDAKIAVGIDVTRNHIRFAVVNLNNQILVSEHDPFRAHQICPETEDEILRMYHAFLITHDVDPARIIGIGISLPGIVDGKEHILKYSHVLNLRQAYPLERLKHLFNKPVLFLNDANAACYSECYFEDTPESFVYVSLSNSIGGALFTNGSLFEGEGYKGLEIGHMRLYPDGRKCYCGHRGHYDAYGSALLLSDAANGSLPVFFSELARGNQQYAALLSDYIEHLAQLIYNLRVCFDEPIVLGGYVGGYLGPYLDTIRKRVRELDLFDEDGAYLSISHYHFEAATVGIAKYLIQQYIRTL